MTPPCPHCGAPLDQIGSDGQTAPWLCQVCRRGWWDAELTDQARAAWQPQLGCHTFDARPGLVGAIDQEAAAARGGDR